MPSCFALFCSHDSRKESCRMFKFPTNPDQRRQWLNNTRRTDAYLKPSSRICSCHFAKGKKQYGPTLFAWTNYISKIHRDLDNEKIPKDDSPSTSQENLALPIEDVPANIFEVEIKTEKDANVIDSTNLIEELQPITKSTSTPTPNPEVKTTNVKVLTPPNKQNKPQRRSSKQGEHEAVKLRVDNLIMKHEIEELENRIRNSNENLDYQYERLTIEKLENNVELLMCYTGLNTFSAFHYILEKISKSEYDLKYDKWSVVNLRLSEQLLMTLMKLKTNYGYSDIAYRFRVSSCTVKNIVWTFVDALHNIFYMQGIETHPFPYFIGSGVDLPPEFQNFSNCRIVLGSLELESEISRSYTDLDYKHKVLKTLIGVSPLGNFIFVSELYPESTSLREIVMKSGLVNKLSSGDLILSDEELDIETILPSGVDLNVPLLMEHDDLMSRSQIFQDISTAMQGLDFAIRRLKEFAILDRIILAYRAKASKIVQTCCALIKLESLIKEETEDLTFEING